MKGNMIIQALKSILSIKLKSRQDGYTDQFQRVIMVKVLLICSIIIAVDYFSDKVNCIIPTGNKGSLSSGYINEACWINGFYIYEELGTSLKHSAYFGIPNQIDFDGWTNRYDVPCPTSDIFSKHHRPGCREMTKVYYLQYQYLPFYIGALSVCFYMPYLFFRMVNSDLLSLKNTVKDYKGDVDGLIRNYFNYNVISQAQLRLKIWGNIFVKTLYVFSSLLSFYLTDNLLLGRYLTYGRDFVRYAMKSITKRHGKIKDREEAKPGNVLLPSMGFCDIHEASKDIIKSFHNVNKLICEISPHILYQYVLMVLWFFFITSIAVSIMGLTGYLVRHSYCLLYYGKTSAKNSIHRFLTLREIEYLQYIKRKDIMVYGDVIRKLQESVKEMQGKTHNDNNSEQPPINPMYRNGGHPGYPGPREEFIMQHFRKSEDEKTLKNKQTDPEVRPINCIQ